MPLSPPDTTSTWLGWGNDLALKSLPHGTGDTYSDVALLEPFIEVQPQLSPGLPVLLHMWVPVREDDLPAIVWMSIDNRRERQDKSSLWSEQFPCSFLCLPDGDRVENNIYWCRSDPRQRLLQSVKRKVSIDHMRGAESFKVVGML